MQTDLVCAHIAFDLNYYKIVLVQSYEAWRARFLQKTSKNGKPYQWVKIKRYNQKIFETQKLYIVVLKTKKWCPIFRSFSGHRNIRIRGSCILISYYTKNKNQKKKLFKSILITECI